MGLIKVGATDTRIQVNGSTEYGWTEQSQNTTYEVTTESDLNLSMVSQDYFAWGYEEESNQTYNISSYSVWVTDFRPDYSNHQLTVELNGTEVWSQSGDVGWSDYIFCTPGDTLVVKPQVVTNDSTLYVRAHLNWGTNNTPSGWANSFHLPPQSGSVSTS